MRGPALVGHAPRRLRWSADGEILRFEWAKADGKGDPEYMQYQVRRDGTGLGRATPETLEDRIARSAQRDAGRTLYQKDGALYLREPQQTEARRLTEGSWAWAYRGFQGAPRFVEGGRAVAFVHGEGFYRIDLATGKTEQRAHLALPEPTQPRPFATESQQALARAQSVLRYFAGAGEADPRPTPERRAREGEKGGVAIAVPKGWRAALADVEISPSGRYAAVGVAEEVYQGRDTEVPTYVTGSGYTGMIRSYPKVGDAHGTSSVLVADLETGSATILAPPRRGSVGRARWSPDGARLIAYANADDHKDAWILAYDPASGASKVVWDEHDDAWVGGPGEGFLQWTPEGRVAFETERNGFANLWSMASDGSDAKPLVAGRFEVSNVTRDAPRGRFVFVSSEGSPFRRHVDAVPFAGGVVTRLAELSADEDATFEVAPDGTLAVVRSSPARPAELWIGGKQVTDTPIEEWKAYPWIEAPIVMVPARDGAMVPAKLYKPKKWRRGGPAVVFVHGAGYLQNVYEGWSHYFRETMFNQLLMQKGYAVLDLDFRASAGYGKAWRTAIYRHMGGKDLDDNVDGARYLVRSLGVNPKRIGLYGGSYGGFLTLMAMFKEGDAFAAGAALRPVADWRNYNHSYTSEILNDPQDDPEAYRQSSPIEFAEGLKGGLLICHGMVDVNVHFQDSVRLTERLIELGKTGWSIAPYPVEDHAFIRPESWTDEYRRILDLFDRTIGPSWKK